MRVILLNGDISIVFIDIQLLRKKSPTLITLFNDVKSILDKKEHSRRKLVPILYTLSKFSNRIVLRVVC